MQLRHPHPLRNTVRLFILAAIALGLLTPSFAADTDTRRVGFTRALDAAEKRPLAEFASTAHPYADHPLAAYLDYAALRRQLDHVDASSIVAFVERHADIPIAATLRNEALRALARREDWPGFRQLYKGSSDVALRCGDLLSRRLPAPDAAWLDSALQLWLSGTSQPSQCDAVFDTLRRSGQLTPIRHWERIELAAVETNLGLMRWLARALPAAEAALAQSYAAYLEAPTQAPTASWPADARSRRIGALGIVRMAQRDPGAAEALLGSLQGRLGFEATQRGEMLNHIALWSAASYLPDSTRRFANVPAEAWDARLHEWQVREALARGDDTAAIAAIERMPADQRAEPRWRYFHARLRERGGDAAARLAFAELATEPTYFGFLAADRLGAPYALCPLEANDVAATRRVQANPGFVRAMELHAIGRVSWARREWEALRATLPDDERRAAVALIDAAGWHERAASTLNAGDDLRHYTLRFPLPHQRQILREARRHGLDPAWIAALIRAESAWAPDARSHADARGLMQLLPATARMEARKRGLRYPGDSGLYDPRENLALGIAHLASMLEKHGGQPFLATAAYNAGPTPVARWLAQRPPQDIDLWIETIPYRETREYVARILAFAAIYDWRLDGKAVPISARAQGHRTPVAARRDFACPAAAPEKTP
ncbi:transglycosylase SLT domain-containing protein [Xanthomonadaceae bacterium JHOS43]|nr:transglycosylase SLT domain-containing protein [Xanthomonadaceae bacterium JHOS43]